MTKYFRREAKFMLLWLILVPVVCLIVALIALPFLPTDREYSATEAALIRGIEQSAQLRRLATNCRCCDQIIARRCSQIVNMENGRGIVGLVDFILLAKSVGVDSVALCERVARWCRAGRPVRTQVLDRYG